MKYIPILKWKAGEKAALEEIKESNKDTLIPLIELLMPTLSSKEQKDLTVEEKCAASIKKFKEKELVKIHGEIIKAWGNRPIYVDFSLLYSSELKIETINTLNEEGIYELDIIPVLNIYEDSKIKELICNNLKKNKKCFALRITVTDLEDIDQFNKNIASFLSNYDINESDVDIIVDVKELTNPKYLKMAQGILNLKKWRHFAFCSGAFPETLSGCKLDEITYLPRTDWHNWLNFRESTDYVRLPWFGDYAIRHPIYNEVAMFITPSTSIKYTTNSQWAIYKGEKLRYEHYIANASLLYKNSELYYGEHFSFGDAYIASKARHFEDYIRNPEIKGTGRTQDWIMAGISHHIACVTHQLTSLSAN